MIRPTAVFGVLVLATVASAQDDIQQIKQKIAELHQQLEAIESAPPKRNVTQIGASRARKTETGLVVRIYDLGDLFAVAPPYPAQLQSDLSPQHRTAMFETTEFLKGGMGGMGGGFFNIGPAAASVNSLATRSAMGTATASQAGAAGSVKLGQEELIQVIRETINPEIWRDGAKITKLGNAFVISADDDSHQQIEALLNLFRARWGTLRTVSVRAWWMTLSPAELRTLLNDPTEKLDPDGPPVFGIVSDDAWKELLQIWEQPAGNDAHRLRYQATLTCYNGQTVSSISGTQDLAVSGVETIVATQDGEKGQTGYQPELALIQQGLAFQVTPVTNISGRTVLLDIHSRLSLPAAVDDDAVKKRSSDVVFPEDIVRTIDRRRINIHRLSTTARVPVNRPYLIGGMSMPAADTEGLQMYLFVKVSVQELRNDQEQAEQPAGEKGAKPPLNPDETKSEKPDDAKSDS